MALAVGMVIAPHAFTAEILRRPLVAWPTRLLPPTDGVAITCGLGLAAALG
jgi:hypothetical protein